MAGSVADGSRGPAGAAGPGPGGLGGLEDAGVSREARGVGGAGGAGGLRGAEASDLPGVSGHSCPYDLSGVVGVPEMTGVFGLPWRAGRGSVVQDHVALAEIELCGELMIAAEEAGEERLSIQRIDEVLGAVPPQTASFASAAPPSAPPSPPSAAPTEPPPAAAGADHGGTDGPGARGGRCPSSRPH